MTIAILGSNGMLGGMVKAHFRRMKRPYITAHEITSSDFRVHPDSTKSIFAKLDKVIPIEAEYIVNCIGAIKPKFKDNNLLQDNIFVNAVFPHMLADWGKFRNRKVIHITTDCVFDGFSGGYTESSHHNALDNYGKSKSLGEPTNCMTIRTSIIGPEFGGNKRSLVEWLLSNTGGEVNGFTNHLWNGVTTLELAKCIEKIVKMEMYEDGIFHIFSEDISKYDLLCLMNFVWSLGIVINNIESPTYCNRTLRTEKGLNAVLNISSQTKMARELRRYIVMDRK